jgi:thiol-disulfide isomerase/thioredoxin
MIKKLTLLAIVCCQLTTVEAQPGKVTPERPSQNDILTIIYNLDDPKALLNSKEPVYARITNYSQDGAVQKFHVRLKGEDRILSEQTQLPKHTASCKIEFYTLNKDDENATKNLLVYDSKHHKPVRGAYMQGFFNDKPDSIFHVEVSNYPDNYLAYAKYINVISMVKQADTAKVEIHSLIDKLQYAVKSEIHSDPSLLTALCVAYSKSGDLNNGKVYLNKLFAQFPLRQETAFAFSIYNYEYYKSSGKDVEEDVRLELKNLFINYPDAAISKDENVFHYLQKFKEIPVKDFERVLKPLYTDDKISYYAFTDLPEVYIANNAKLDSAAMLLKNGIKRFYDGSINHQYRLNNNHFKMYVPYMLLDLVKINITQSNFQDAITNASAALNILIGSNTEGNFVPLLLPLRAFAYKQAGNFNMAMEDYRQLYKAGYSSALDSMKRIFAQCNLKQKTLDEFLGNNNIKSSDKSSSTSQQAPNFAATDLNGKTVHLSDFKGKLVVLNIWGIGCGPCVAEMPELNNIVKQYHDKPDVIFLAITADKTENIKKFLKIHSFAYNILNNAGNLTETFNTNALPVHMVIGRQGEIINRSIGARPDIKEYLHQLINSNL